MIKVVANGCFGGFGLSHDAILRFCELKGFQVSFDHGRYGRVYTVDGHQYWSDSDIDRHDPILVQVVEEMGEAANGEHASLYIEQIEGNQYLIDEYDGTETVLTPQTMQWVTV